MWTGYGGLCRPRVCVRARSMMCSRIAQHAGHARTDEAVAEGAPRVEEALQALHVDQEVDDVLVREVGPCRDAACMGNAAGMSEWIIVQVRKVPLTTGSSGNP